MKILDATIDTERKNIKSEVAMEFEKPHIHTENQNKAEIALNEKCQQLLNTIIATRHFMDSYSMLQFGRLYAGGISAKISLHAHNILSSIEQTLGSIEGSCRLGNFSDAYVLIRKYRDDLFFCLYIDVVSNELKKPDTDITFDELQSNFLDDPNDEKLIEFVMNAYNGILESANKDKSYQDIVLWSENQRQSDLHFSDVLKRIGNSLAIKDAVNKYNLQTIFNNIAITLNNFVHGNGASYYNKFLHAYGDSELERVCENITSIMNTITVTFAFLAALHSPISIMANEYIDYLDFGEQPPDGSPYWVAQFVVDFFKTHKNILGDDCVNYLEKETGMQFEQV